MAIVKKIVAIYLVILAALVGVHFIFGPSVSGHAGLG